MTLDYEVAIPSFRRVECLATKTLPLLRARGVPDEAITVFVADATEAVAYREVWDGRLVIAVPGIGAVRNFMAHHYPEGTRVFGIDDDVSDVIERLDANTSAPVASIDRLVREAFAMLDAAHLRLWGIYPVANAYFMRPKVTTDLRYIVACFYGWVSTHDDAALVDLDDKEDFERSIKRYLADGGVLRIGWVAPVTRYYREPGGMQVERTPERVEWSAHELVRRYPELCTLNTRKKEHAEVVLRDRRPRST